MIEFDGDDTSLDICKALYMTTEDFLWIFKAYFLLIWGTKVFDAIFNVGEKACKVGTHKLDCWTAKA